MEKFRGSSPLVNHCPPLLFSPNFASIQFLHTLPRPSQPDPAAMSLAPLRSLAPQLPALRQALGATAARSFASGSDPLKDPRTTSAQQKAHETDEATKDSVSPAFEPAGALGLSACPGQQQAEQQRGCRAGWSPAARGKLAGRLAWAASARPRGREQLGQRHEQLQPPALRSSTAAHTVPPRVATQRRPLHGIGLCPCCSRPCAAMHV